MGKSIISGSKHSRSYIKTSINQMQFFEILLQPPHTIFKLASPGRSQILAADTYSVGHPLFRVDKILSQESFVPNFNFLTPADTEIWLQTRFSVFRVKTVEFSKNEKIFPKCGYK